MSADDEDPGRDDTVVGGSLPERLTEGQRRESVGEDEALAHFLRPEDVTEPIPLERIKSRPADDEEVVEAEEDDSPAETTDAEPVEAAQLEEIPIDKASIPTEVIRQPQRPDLGDLALEVDEESASYRRNVLRLLVLLNVFGAANLVLLAFFVLQGAPTTAATEPAVETPAATEELDTPDGEPAPVETAPAPVKKPVVHKKPAPRPAPAPEPEPAPVAAPVGGSALTLKVVGKSAAAGKIAAKVYVDDHYVGEAPIASYPVQPGRRRVRFDCVFEGQTHRGTDKVLDIPADTEAVIEHTCDVWVLPR